MCILLLSMCKAHAYGAPEPADASFCPSCEGEKLAQRDRNRPRGHWKRQRKNNMDGDYTDDDETPSWDDC